MLTTPNLTPPATNPNASSLLRRATAGFTASLMGNISATDQTITLSSTATLSTDTAVTLFIAPKTDKQEVVIGYVQNNNVVNLSRGIEGPAYDHLAGVVVTMYASAMDQNSIVDFGLKEHNGDGSHKANMTIGGKTFAETVAAAAFFPGMTMEYSGATAPAGWLLENGAVYQQSAYPALFGVIGTRYNIGTEAAGQFRVPNHAGRVGVGLDATQTAFNTLGKIGGASTHTLTLAEMPAHKHTFTTFDVANTNAFALNDRSSDAVASADNATDTVNGEYRTGLHSTDNSGSGTAHNNLQPYIVKNWIIKT